MKSSRWFVAGMLAVALAFAVASGWVASALPDGLEKVAETTGFASKAEEPAAQSPLSGYGVGGKWSDPWMVALSGAIGVLLTFGTAWLAGSLLRGRKRAPRLHR